VDRRRAVQAIGKLLGITTYSTFITAGEFKVSLGPAPDGLTIEC